MIIFADVNSINSVVSKVAINIEKIFEIYVSGSAIHIAYNSGEMIEIEGKYVSKLETVSVKYSDTEKAEKDFLCFYKACFNNRGCFYFSNVKEANNK